MSLPRELIVLGNSQIATNSTGDKLVMTIPYKCIVERVFAVVEEASTHATGFVIKFDNRPTAGSDTGRGDGDVGALTKTVSVSQQGKMLYEEPSSTITLNEGEQVVAEVTTANGDACTAVVGIVVRPMAERPANNTAMVSV